MPDGSEEAPSASPIVRERASILLVEDHEATRSVLTTLLQQRHYRVVATDTVTEALRLAAAQPFEFVVSDLGLPDGSGYDLMKTLQKRHGLKGIALSGYGMEQDIVRSREAGFVGHLTKPVTFRTLEKVIESVCAASAGEKI